MYEVGPPKIPVYAYETNAREIDKSMLHMPKRLRHILNYICFIAISNICYLSRRWLIRTFTEHTQLKIKYQSLYLLLTYPSCPQQTYCFFVCLLYLCSLPMNLQYHRLISVMRFPAGVPPNRQCVEKGICSDKSNRLTCYTIAQLHSKLPIMPIEFFILNRPERISHVIQSPSE